MKKCGLIYGSCTGNTEIVAERIVEVLKPDLELSLVEIGSVEARDLARWDFLICGVPTWDIGELEYGWQDIYDNLDGVELEGLTVAMFGLGDQEGYPETYQDAMGILYKKLVERGAKGGIGFTSTEGHDFQESQGLIEGRFCGLALDEDCQDDLTEERIQQWATQLKSEWAAILESQKVTV